MKNSLLFLLFLTSCYFSFGQKEDAIKYLELNKKDKEYLIEDYAAYFIDSTRSLSFEEVKSQQFIKLKEPPKAPLSITWYKFYVQPKTDATQLVFSPHIVDFSNVYVPFNDGYKEYYIGLLSKKKVINDISDAVIIHFFTDSLDFKKPFYYTKKVVSHTSNKTLQYSGIVVLTDNPNNWIYKSIVEHSYTNQFELYLSIIFISFLMFLVNYIVSKDVNFLNYSLYLLFTVLIFVTEIPLLNNLLKSIHPMLGFYIVKLSVVITSAVYFYFVIQFIDAEHKFPKIYKLARYVVLGSFIFAGLYLFQKVFFPYFKYRFYLVMIFNIVFLLISVIFFIYLISKPMNIAKRIVVIGSLFLIVGHILSIVKGNNFYFLNMVLIEIIIFSSAVSLQNKLRNKKQLISEIALNDEKNKRENLQELDTMKSKFFSNVSHEFRTPLTLISGPIQRLLKKNELTKEDRNSLELIQRNSDRLLTLVNQLLDISKVEAGKSQLRISKNEIIPFTETLIKSFKFLAQQKQLKFKIISTDTSEDTWFDKDIVEKIVVNLLSNAVKYTPENGEIVCETFVHNSQFYFEIKNSGEQLTSVEIKKIFDRFYQIDEHKQGTGIGLSLVKEIVNLHKGTITAQSTKKWTTFKVVLPIAKLEYKNVDEKELSKNKKEELNILPTETAIKNETTIDEISDEPILLIVEDNADVRAYVDAIFNSNYTIVQAENGQKGIEQAIKYIPDVIISDIMMPVKDGIELCNTLKNDERTSHIPIVLLTAKVGDENEIKGVKTGADDYITKPFNDELLKLKVDRLIAVRKKLQERYSQEIILTPTDVHINSADELFLKRLQSISETDITETSFGVDEFSKIVGMSRMQLHRKIKAMFGMTTSEFIRLQRLKLAAKLLKQSDVNVSQVGYGVGFNSASYFSTCFKKEFGMSPTQYVETLTK